MRDYKRIGVTQHVRPQVTQIGEELSWPPFFHPFLSCTLPGYRPISPTILTPFPLLPISLLPVSYFTPLLLLYLTPFFLLFISSLCPPICQSKPSPLFTYHLPGIVPPPPLLQLSPPAKISLKKGPNRNVTYPCPSKMLLDTPSYSSTLCCNLTKTHCTVYSSNAQTP